MLRGRPSKDAPGAGHCATVLAVDATQPAADPAVQAPQLIASGGHMGDGSIRIWELGGAAPMDAA